jgi:hypothetical protein
MATTISPSVPQGELTPCVNPYQSPDDKGYQLKIDCFS